MQATIYVTDQALAVANEIKDLTQSERLALTDDSATDLSQSEGYFLKSANRLDLAALPPDALVGRRLTPELPEVYARHVSIPSNLRGCIFENAPNLPERYAAIVAYWSGPPVNSNTSGACHFQPTENEYMVDMSALDAVRADDGDEADASALIDDLLSEGVVVCITDIEPLIDDLSIHDYIEIQVPVDGMLGIEPDDFRSTKPYPTGQSKQYERVFLKVADIVRSPDRHQIYIDLLRHELLDYGYWH
jgi:hypothetical protein